MRVLKEADPVTKAVQSRVYGLRLVRAAVCSQLESVRAAWATLLLYRSFGRRSEQLLCCSCPARAHCSRIKCVYMHASVAQNPSTVTDLGPQQNDDEDESSDFGSDGDVDDADAETRRALEQYRASRLVRSLCSPLETAPESLSFAVVTSSAIVIFPTSHPLLRSRASIPSERARQAR